MRAELSILFSSVGSPIEAFRERCKQLEMASEWILELEFSWQSKADRLFLDMRRWAPMILQQCNQDDVADEQVRLEAAPVHAGKCQLDGKGNFRTMHRVHQTLHVAAEARCNTTRTFHSQ